MIAQPQVPPRLHDPHYAIKFQIQQAPGENLPVYKYMPNRPHENNATHTGMRQRYKYSCQGSNRPADGEVSTTLRAMMQHPCNCQHNAMAVLYSTQNPGWNFNRTHRADRIDCLEPLGRDLPALRGLGRALGRG